MVIIVSFFAIVFILFSFFDFTFGFVLLVQR